MSSANLEFTLSTLNTIMSVMCADPYSNLFWLILSGNWYELNRLEQRNIPELIGILQKKTCYDGYINNQQSLIPQFFTYFDHLKLRLDGDGIPEDSLTLPKDIISKVFDDNKCFRAYIEVK